MSWIYDNNHFTNLERLLLVKTANDIQATIIQIKRRKTYRSKQARNQSMNWIKDNTNFIIIQKKQFLLNQAISYQLQ